MPDHQDLLDEARPYCDASTGEVLERIPDDLMRRLRAARLARGVPRLKNQNTQTQATWYVFLTDQIREQITVACRDANSQRRRARKSKARSSNQSSADDSNRRPTAPVDKRGLADFRESRRPPK
jgi:hypothetical protein